MSFLGEVAQPTAHIPNRNYAWQKGGSLSAKSKALVKGPFREEPQQQSHWKGPFERSPEVAASIAQRPISAEDLSYTGDFTFGDRVSDDVFHETKKFIRKARHRRPVSPSKPPQQAEELLGGAEGTDARDTMAVAESTIEPGPIARRRGAPNPGQRPAVVGELSDERSSDFAGAPGDQARYREGPRGHSRPSSRQSSGSAEPTEPQSPDDEGQFEMPEDPPSAPCAYLGKHLRRNSPRKAAQHGWEEEEEADLEDSSGGLPGGGANTISLAGRRKKRHEKNIAVQAQILTALVTGDQVSYLTMESEFRKSMAKTAAANPWALTANQSAATMLGDARGWTRPEPEPEPEPEPQQDERLSPRKRPHRRWFGYGPAPPVEPEPEPEPEPEFTPSGFDLHYPAGSHPPQPEPEPPEPEPEPYRSPIADLPTGSYWLEQGGASREPPKCTCHPTKGVAGCRLHDPNYKHPNPKELQTPPSWMFKGAASYCLSAARYIGRCLLPSKVAAAKLDRSLRLRSLCLCSLCLCLCACVLVCLSGNTALNDEMTKIKDEYTAYVVSGGAKQAEKKRDAFLMRSFLMLRARLSFST